jgi:hypothetical protein
VNPVSRGGRWDFARSIDREDDHGEEVEGKEEIHEEEGRAGAQEEENSKVGCEEDRKESAEESREEGCSEAQGTGKETGPGKEAGSGEEAGSAAGADGRACACSVLASASQFGLRRQRQHLTFLTGLERSKRLRR